MATAVKTSGDAQAITIWQQVSYGTEYPEQDLVPERYRVRSRGFEGPVDTVSTMTGVILAVRAARWLPDPESPEDAPLTQCELVAPGVGAWRVNPADPETQIELRECATCPMNKWGSAGDGRKGKACREKRLLLVLRDGEAIPVVVVAPPTSILSVARWETRAAARRLRLGQIHIKLSTQPQKHGQEEWGVLQIEELGLLDDAAQDVLVTRLLNGPLAEMYQKWTAPPVQQDAAM